MIECNFTVICVNGNITIDLLKEVLVVLTMVIYLRKQEYNNLKPNKYFLYKR